MGLRTFNTWQEASDAATENESVCGAYAEVAEGEDPYSRPVYFLAPRDASDDLMRELSFEARFGRPMDGYQRWALEEAKAK